MGPFGHFVLSVAYIGLGAECPLITILLNDVRAYGHESGESHDLFEIWASGMKGNLEGFLVDGLYTKFALVHFTCHYLVCIENNVCHVAIVCSGIRVNKTLPCINKVSCYNIFAVGPLDVITKLYGVNGLISVRRNFLCLTESQGCIAAAIINPLVETFKNVVDHNCAVNCGVECRVDGVGFRCEVHGDLKVFG